MRVLRLPSAGMAVLIVASAAPAAAQDYYADIRPQLVRSCLGCHSSRGPGWSMEDPEATYALRHAIANAILERRMPPWLAEPGHQEYVGDVGLPGDVLELVRRWSDGGFPKGEVRPDPDTRWLAEHGKSEHAGFRPDVSLEVLPGNRYLPDQAKADDYRCFVLDWPRDRATYVTGFRALPGNLAVAHHLVVYAIVPEVLARYREAEQEEEGAGYQCFGGAVPDRLVEPGMREAYEARYPNGIRALSRGNFWLAHWAPGMDGHVFPEGTGIRMVPGSGLVVQMHYYSRTAPGQPDAGTRMEFRVAEQVERPAFHFAQTDNRWLTAADNGSMVIPAGRQATYQTADTLRSLLGLVARVTGVAPERVQGLEIHSANLHMHAIGHSGVITLADSRGTETLLSVPRWDLRWQRDFTLAKPKVFSKDGLRAAVLAVRCTFQNPRSEPVYGGYGSGEEMCFNFSYIAVRVGDAAPATRSPR